MKRVLTVILALILILALPACGKTAVNNQPESTPPTESGAQASITPPEPETPKSAEPVELVVFAAASMTETLTEIAELYKAAAPHVTLTFTFESSGTLLTQIKEGADCDIFISAAQKQMNELDITSDKNQYGSDYLLPGMRFNLVENKVALVVPDGNPAVITSFEGVTGASAIALGNSDVPVGQYSEELFTNMGIWDELQGKITFGTNVKEVTSWVSEGAVDCGVVYSTDAYSAGLEIVAYAPEGTIKTPILYPAAVLKDTSNPEEAAAFLEFLKMDACAKVFESVGFGIAR